MFCKAGTLAWLVCCTLHVLDLVIPHIVCKQLADGRVSNMDNVCVVDQVITVVYRQWRAGEEFLVCIQEGELVCVS